MSGHLVSGGDTSGCAWCHQVTPRVPAPMLWRPVIGRPVGRHRFDIGCGGRGERHSWPKLFGGGLLHCYVLNTLNHGIDCILYNGD